jgi:hypothetical protein
MGAGGGGRESGELRREGEDRVLIEGGEKDRQ